MKSRIKFSFFRFIIISSVLILSVSCKKNNVVTPDSKIVADGDGNIYKTTAIGSQVWMTENLKTTRYNDGTLILKVSGFSSWAYLNKPAYCWYNNDSITYKNLYGALYNGYAATSDRLCPVGWHVSTIEDWIKLETYLGLTSAQIDSLGFRGTDEGDKLKTGDGWINKTGTNESGFGAIAAGYRHTSGGSYIGSGLYTTFWTSSHWISDYSRTEAIWLRQLEYNDSRIFSSFVLPGFGFSVRCLKD